MVGEIEIQDGYKKTDIGIIPSDWDIKKGVDLSEKITKGASPRWQGFSYQDYGILFVTSENVRAGWLDILEPKYLPFSFSEKQKNSQLSNGDILINIVGASIGRACIFNQNVPANINQAVCLFRPNQVANPYYLFHFFQSPSTIKKLIGSQVESARPNLSLTDIREFKIVLPPNEEQTAIATALNDTDKLITQLEKLIAKKQLIKQGTMQELLRPKEGWKVKKLGEVLTIKHGKSQKEVVTENGSYPILASGGKIGKAKSFLYNKPSVLIGRKGTIDEPQFMDKPFWCVDTLFYSEINDDYNAKFIYYMFKLIDWYAYNEASGVPSLNAKTIELIEKHFPKSKDEQIQITQILFDMDIEIDELERKLAKYNMLKQGMMQNLLTGKIRLV